MAKIKLKSVQNGTRGDNVNLFTFGDLFMDESGNWVDNSGNIIDGYIRIEGGHNDLYVGTQPSFRVPVKWGSGIIYPPISMGDHNPAVDVEFGNIELIEGSNGYDILTGVSSVITEWNSPFEADYHFSYTLSKGNGQMSGTQYGRYLIQFEFIANTSHSD